MGFFEIKLEKLKKIYLEKVCENEELKKENEELNIKIDFMCDNFIDETSPIYCDNYDFCDNQTRPYDIERFDRAWICEDCDKKETKD